jgi:hypothetical protein
MPPLLLIQKRGLHPMKPVQSVTPLFLVLQWSLFLLGANALLPLHSSQAHSENSNALYNSRDCRNWDRRTNIRSQDIGGINYQIRDLQGQRTRATLLSEQIRLDRRIRQLEIRKQSAERDYQRAYRQSIQACNVGRSNRATGDNAAALRTSRQAERQSRVEQRRLRRAPLPSEEPPF